ncbi:toll/interleukin-1 receptor domain-containing protein [Alcanivorax sp. 1008]|uniref:toll/interleukin-1 receptor domain-containing protein n=1 Tax=Alcanivorax sp. 1008 TaxID=2816853 RepID=UPI001E09B613|nr:toll/interleukin-1 receptor domain-containing protein [Alcanivorax sp. 1008]MCC1498076.1 toll/interleukin-1 receptor domain-containing protein [Alcanivorax sp. 1008]
MVENPKVFISYSHDDEDHKEWVYRLATDLMGKGIDTVLDQWDLELGANLPKFMENGLQASDRVLAVCTDNYIDKSNGGIGGVGYESTILTAELLMNQKTTKFIPVVRSVTKSMKTPLCLAGRMYIDFSIDENYADSLNQLVHEVYGLKQRPRPKLGPNPFKPNEKEKPRLGESSTTFFHKRFSSAFPGVRGINWFEENEAIDRLMILLEQPLVFEDGIPIWWWRNGDLQIKKFENIGEGVALMDGQELSIKKIAAVNAGSYYQSFVYVEVDPMKPTGLYQYDFQSSIENFGYASEEYAIFDGHNITREEYDDNAAVVNGKPVDLAGNAEFRLRYLTPYNFLIAAQNSPINNNSYYRTRRIHLNQILEGNLGLEDLTDEILKLPKRGY